MPNHYVPDAVALQRDPNLSAFTFDPGAHQAAFESNTGQAIFNCVCSRAGVAALVGAIGAASSRPPVVGLEHILFQIVGEAAFANEQKKLTGRIVRYIVEHLGGRWVRSRVKVNVASRYYSGSIYSFA